MPPSVRRGSAGWEDGGEGPHTRAAGQHPTWGPRGRSQQRTRLRGHRISLISLSLIANVSRTNRTPGNPHPGGPIVSSWAPIGPKTTSNPHPSPEPEHLAHFSEGKLRCRGFPREITEPGRGRTPQPFPGQLPWQRWEAPFPTLGTGLRAASAGQPPAQPHSQAHICTGTSLWYLLCTPRAHHCPLGCWGAQVPPSFSLSASFPHTRPAWCPPQPRQLPSTHALQEALHCLCPAHHSGKGKENPEDQTAIPAAPSPHLATVGPAQGCVLELLKHQPKTGGGTTLALPLAQ